MIPKPETERLHMKRVRTVENRDPEPVNRDPQPVNRGPRQKRRAVVVHQRVRCPVCGGKDIVFDGGSHATADGRRIKYGFCRSEIARGVVCGARVTVIET